MVILISGDLTLLIASLITRHFRKTSGVSISSAVYISINREEVKNVTQIYRFISSFHKVDPREGSGNGKEKNKQSQVANKTNFSAIDPFVKTAEEYKTE